MPEKLTGIAIALGEARVLSRMNKTEAAYYDHLKNLRYAGEIAECRFESIKFRLADSCWYKPDFEVVLSCGTIEIHEVKAQWRTGKPGYRSRDSRPRIKVAAELYPWYRWKLVWPDGGRWAEELIGG